MSEPSSDIRPIVVGIDGSPGAQHALEWALAEAAVRKASLQVVHAWEPPAPVSGIGSIIAPLDAAPYEQAAKELLEETITRELARFDGPPLMIVPTLVRGYAATELLAAATRAQLLVVGSRGRGGFAGLMLGSVSQHCLHHAHGPVVVVPHSSERSAT